MEGFNIIRTIKCVLYPTSQQIELFNKISGIARFTYNHCLAFKIKKYEEGYSTSIKDCVNEIKRIKYTDDFKWIQEAPEAVTKQVVKDLDRAFKNFYKKTSKFPRFKSKKNSKYSFYQRTDNLKITKDYLYLTKIGKVKYRCTQKDRPFIEKDSDFKNPRVTFDGKYWILTFGVEVKPSIEKLTGGIIGIDLGIKTLATLSNGKIYKGLRYDTSYSKYYNKLKRMQRKLSHKYECNKNIGNDKYYESNHIKNIKKEIKILNKKLRDIRNTYLDTITKEIVKTKPSLIVMEDLDVKGMMKNKHLSERVQEQSFYMFKLKLKNKAEMYGIDFMEANRFYPSSKLCSSCGAIKKDLKLKDRTYECDCGLLMCRDLNASINLMNYGKQTMLDNN